MSASSAHGKKKGGHPYADIESSGAKVKLHQAALIRSWFVMSMHLHPEQIYTPKSRIVLSRQGAQHRFTLLMAFPFLKLPPELRCIVYDLVLKVARPIPVRKTARPLIEGIITRSGKRLRPRMTAEQEQRAGGTSTLALTATCRLIYLEAVDVYYASNAFECCTTASLPDFLDSIGTTNMALISEIRFHVRKDDDLATLEQLPRLRILKVVLGSRCPDCKDDQVRRRSRGWYKNAQAELWSFCSRSPNLEKIRLLRASTWAGFRNYPRLMEFRYEISAMNEYLKQVKKDLEASVLSDKEKALFSYHR